MAEQESKQTKSSLIQQKYAEFLPREEGVNPQQVYDQWKRSIFGGEKPDDSTMYFVLSQAKAAGIDPRVPRQIYAIPFKDKRTGDVTWQVIIGIEGLVTIAENTGTYGGTTKPDYEFDEEDKPVNCTVGVHKVVHGVPLISYQTVYFSEYAKTGTSNRPSMWETKPLTMLKKVAHAHALRATFSACAGLYIEEEIQKGEEDYIEAAPDVLEKIDSAESIQEVRDIVAELSPEDKKRTTERVNQRIAELKGESSDGTDTANE